MTSLRPILRKATITLELSIYDPVRVDELKVLCDQIICAAGSRASCSQYHLQWIARAETEILVEAGHNTKRIHEEHGSYNDVEFSINEGIEGENEKGIANARAVQDEARDELRHT